MKTNKTFLLLLGAILLLASAFLLKKPAQENYLIFGHFYKECADGECMKVYKIEHNSLYLYLEDSTNYPSFNQFHTGKFRKLPQEKYSQVSLLAQKIPQELLNTQRGFIGKTEHDWSGYYIEYARGSEKKFWIFDEERRNVPAEFLPLITQIEQSIELLNEK
ncbi:hypothetical protein [Pontibacter chinhatensis]|uniref:Uncharacterized protein n=1 Tax=Pontibacter chinhatensis TaxID=1436961 RepID=A0A1I2UQW9_9BACT|nr:hypothetical protein [Pontibacter chinhatensis]SFG77171.1 hypothetical protein SAMN05421739_103570 [Pontibacter chinhatensis]